MKYEFGVMSSKWSLIAEDDTTAYITMCLVINKNIPIAVYSPKTFSFMPLDILEKNKNTYNKDKISIALSTVKEEIKNGFDINLQMENAQSDEEFDELEDRMWISLDSLKKVLDKLEHSYDNCNKILCGCGCGQYIDFNHGTISRVITDLRKDLSNDNSFYEKEKKGDKK